MNEMKQANLELLRITNEWKDSCTLSSPALPTTFANAITIIAELFSSFLACKEKTKKQKNKKKRKEKNKDMKDNKSIIKR